MNLLKTLIVTGAAVAIVGCKGGGGSSSVSHPTTPVPPNTYYSHSELASEFVTSLNLDAGYDVDLMKVNTEKWNYIVVYDYDLDTYDAYDLTFYNPGEDIYNFLDWHDNDFFYDLDYIGANYYQDYYSGVIFEQTQTSSKDLEKMAALKEAIVVKKKAEVLAAEYGLSESRSLEVAKLANQWGKMDKRGMTDKDHDLFAKEILGVSITDAKEAMKKSLEGDSENLESLIDTAAETNETSPEHINELITDIFMK